MSAAMPPLPTGELPKKKRSKGCLIAVLLAVLAGVLAFVFGGYYTMMYTGVPLRLISSSINSGGAASLEGLKGTLATGVKFDEFRLFKTGLGDSYIRDFSFQFNGMPDISGTARVRIDEFHIGRICLSLPVGETGKGMAGAEIDPELKAEFAGESGGELKRFELKSFRIDEVLIQDAAGERTVGSVKLSDLVAEEGGLRLGEFELVSDHVEARLEATGPTNRFRQQIAGRVRGSLHTNVLQDLPFVVSFGGETNAGAMRLELFAGELVAGMEKDGTSTTIFDGFSPGKWLGSFTRNAPAAMTFSVSANRSGKRSKVTPGTLKLGTTTWQVPQQELDHVGHGGGRLLAETTVGEHRLSVQISDPDRGAGFRYRFTCATLAGDELLARALYARPLAELGDAERERLKDFGEGTGASPAKPSAGL